jgi:hypothetical protein
MPAQARSQHGAQHAKVSPSLWPMWMDRWSFRCGRRKRPAFQQSPSSNQSSLKLRCTAGGGRAGVTAANVSMAIILAGIHAMRGNCEPVRRDGGIRKIARAARDAPSLPRSRSHGWPAMGFSSMACRLGAVRLEAMRLEAMRLEAMRLEVGIDTLVFTSIP